MTNHLPFNKNIGLSKFRMKTVSSIIASVREGDFMFLLDQDHTCTLWQMGLSTSSRSYDLVISHHPRSLQGCSTSYPDGHTREDDYLVIS